MSYGQVACRFACGCKQVRYRAMKYQGRDHNGLPILPKIERVGKVLEWIPVSRHTISNR
jgi:hypothetical protein